MSIDRVELEATEAERFADNAAAARSALSSAQDGNTLWKELFRDLPHPLHPPYGLRLVDRPISCLVPLYRQLIVPIRPTSVGGFRRLYGVSLEQFVTLVDQGRIVPLLSKSYSGYPPHFDLLFRGRHIPQAARVRRFLEIQRSNAEAVADIDAFCDELLTIDFEFGPGIGDEFEKDAKARSVRVIREHLFDLAAFGYSVLVDEIMRLKSADTLFWQAAWAAVILTDPFTRGLGGVSHIEQRHLDGLVRVDGSDFLRAATYRLDQSIDLPLGETEDLVRYWDSVDRIDDRSASLDAINAVSDLVRLEDYVAAGETLRESRNLIEGVVAESARRAEVVRLQPLLDFSFSVLAPTAVAAVEPWLGTGVALAATTARTLARKRWDAAIERLTYLLTRANMSLVPRDPIAVGGLVRLAR